VVVTGGAGFIGSHLVARLLADGESVTVIDDLSTGSRENLRHLLTHPRLSVVEARVSEVPDLDQIIGSASFVYHLAAAVGVELVIHSPIRTIETNLRETEAVLAAAALSRTPLLLASTSEVYGKSQKPFFSESDDLLIGPPTFGRWSYACSKLMDEFLALAYLRERSVPVIIARFFNTVGPRQTGRYGMVLPRFIESARAGRPLRIYGDGLQSRCFCLVDDAVEALVRLRRTPAAVGQVVNIGNDEEITILELAQRVLTELSSASTMEFVPYEVAYNPGFEDMRHRRPELIRLESLTGYRPRRSITDIIRATAAL